MVAEGGGADEKGLTFSFKEGSKRGQTGRAGRETRAGVTFADDHDDDHNDNGTDANHGSKVASRQEITTFDGTAGNNQGPTGSVDKMTIPSLPNTFRDGKRYVPSFIPEQIKAEDLEDMKSGDGIVKFETGMVVGDEKAGDGGAYGLELRDKGGATSGPSGRSRHLQDRNGNHQQNERETEALRDDLRHLPPESTIEEYERMPVEAFGEALLRGMGWKEGRGIGRGKKDVEAKELVRRADRLGLGADPATGSKKEKRFIKPGESRQAAQEDLVYVDEKTGAIKSSRPVGSDAKLKKRSELGVVAGKRMYVVGGKHSGFACEVKSIDQGEERATVRLLPSMETVRVTFRDLAEGRARDAAARMPAAKKAKTATTTLPSASNAKPWLYPNIRVRIVDKKASNGRYYLKKGTIVDVKTPETCDIFIDDFREVAQDLHQRQLETVVPKGEGGAVLCVAGKWKGRRGTLLRRTKKSEYVACQLEDEAEILKLHLDDVCELVNG